MTAPRIITRAEREARNRGLGDRVQTVIHAGLDALPMPAATRAAIKGCGGCKKRKDMINKAEKSLIQILSRDYGKTPLSDTSNPPKEEGEKLDIELNNQPPII